jgi:hypothetical protein
MTQAYLNFTKEKSQRWSFHLMVVLNHQGHFQLNLTYIYVERQDLMVTKLGLDPKDVEREKKRRIKSEKSMRTGMFSVWTWINPLSSLGQVVFLSDKDELWWLSEACSKILSIDKMLNGDIHADNSISSWAHEQGVSQELSRNGKLHSSHESDS